MMKYSPAHISYPCNNNYYAMIPALKFVCISKKKDTNYVNVKLCNQDEMSIN